MSAWVIGYDEPRDDGYLDEEERAAAERRREEDADRQLCHEKGD